VRVLCIDGKAVAIAQYEDKTNNFKSNNSYGFEFFSLNSLMDSENFVKYSKIGEKAISSLGNLVIGGVDILDSNILGCVVLEVNGWPDIYDIAESTNQNIFEKFTTAFVSKCVRFREKRNKI
jgi:glutathione synthase/RimK-type ligase-like ATP-grasp enzyme